MSETKNIGRWWADDIEKEERGRRLNKAVDHVRGLSKTRLARDSRHLRLYCPDVAGNGEDALSFLKRDRPQFNLIKQAVDTMTSQVATQKFLPQYVITEGEFTLQRVARLRTRVIDGQFHDQGVHDTMRAAFTECAILGTSHLVGGIDPDNEPFIEKALPGEILVDPRAAVTGKVFEIFRDRAIARDTLLALYPDDEDAIKGAAAPTESSRSLLFLPRDRSLDEVQVREGWFWGPGCKNEKGEPVKGWHVIATSKGVLVDEEWEWGNPTVRMIYQPRPVGYWGIGLAEIGCDSQSRIDELLTRTTECSRIGTTVWMLLDRRAKIRTEQLSNAPMTLVHYEGTGNSPQLQVFNATPPELFAEIDRIRERFLSETGISVMAAENKRPAGLDSAPAQRTYIDITAQRHEPISEQFKTANQGVIALYENLNDRAQKAKPGGYSIKARTQRGMVPLTQNVKWSDVAMPPEKYRLTMLLVPSVPYEMSGRLQAVSEWISSGLITRPNAQRQMLETPDATWTRLELADSDMVFWQLEEILEGRDAQPQPYQNLQIAADIARRAYLVTYSQGAPEAVLAKMRAFIDACLPPPAAPDLIKNGNYGWTPLPGAATGGPGMPDPSQTPPLPTEPQAA